VGVHANWPIPLDGLLSSPAVVPRERNSHGLYAHASLPLVLTYRVTNWWWWASCAAPNPEPGWWAARFTKPKSPGYDTTALLPSGIELEWWVVGEVVRDFL